MAGTLSSQAQSLFMQMWGGFTTGGNTKGVVTSTTAQSSAQELALLDAMYRALIGKAQKRLKIGYMDRLKGGGNAQVLAEIYRTKDGQDLAGAILAKPATVSMTDAQVREALDELARELRPEQENPTFADSFAEIKAFLLEEWQKTCKSLEALVEYEADEQSRKLLEDNLAALQNSITALGTAETADSVYKVIKGQCGGSPNATVRAALNGVSHRQQQAFAEVQENTGATKGLAVASFMDCWQIRSESDGEKIVQTAVLNTEALKAAMKDQILEALNNGYTKLVFAGKETVVRSENGLDENGNLIDVWRAALLEAQAENNHTAIKTAAIQEALDNLVVDENDRVVKDTAGHLIDDVIAGQGVKWKNPTSQQKKAMIFAPGIYGSNAEGIVTGFMRPEQAGVEVQANQREAMGAVSNNPGILVIRATTSPGYYNQPKASRRDGQLYFGDTQDKHDFKVPAQGGVACQTIVSVAEIDAFVKHSFETTPPEGALVFSVPANVVWQNNQWQVVKADVENPTFEELTAEAYVNAINRHQIGKPKAHVMNLEDTTRYMHYGTVPEKDGYGELQSNKLRVVAAANLLGDFYGDTMAQKPVTSLFKDLESGALCALELTAGGTNTMHWMQEKQTGISFHSALNLIAGQQEILARSENEFDKLVAQKMQQTLENMDRFVPWDKGRLRKPKAELTSVQGFFYTFMADLLESIYNHDELGEQQDVTLSADLTMFKTALQSADNSLAREIKEIRRKGDIAHQVAKVIMAPANTTATAEINALKPEIKTYGFGLSERNVKSLYDAQDKAAWFEQMLAKNIQTLQLENLDPISEGTKRWCLAFEAINQNKEKKGINDLFELPSCVNTSKIDAEMLLSVVEALAGEQEQRSESLREAFKGKVTKGSEHYATAWMEVSCGYFPLPEPEKVNRLGKVIESPYPAPDAQKMQVLMASSEVREAMLENLELAKVGPLGGREQAIKDCIKRFSEIACDVHKDSPRELQETFTNQVKAESVNKANQKESSIVRFG